MAYRTQDDASRARLAQLEMRCDELERACDELRAERDDLRKRHAKAMAVLRLIAGAKQMEQRLERSNQRVPSEISREERARMNDVYRFIREEAAKSPEASERPS